MEKSSNSYRGGAVPSFSFSTRERTSWWRNCWDHPTDPAVVFSLRYVPRSFTGTNRSLSIRTPTERPLSARGTYQARTPCRPRRPHQKSNTYIKWSMVVRQNALVKEAITVGREAQARYTSSKNTAGWEEYFFSRRSSLNLKLRIATLCTFSFRYLYSEYMIIFYTGI